MEITGRCITLPIIFLHEYVRKLPFSGRVRLKLESPSPEGRTAGFVTVSARTFGSRRGEPAASTASAVSTPSKQPSSGGHQQPVSNDQVCFVGIMPAQFTAYKSWLNYCSQVARMLQAKEGRMADQREDKNSRNKGTAVL